MNFLVDDDTLFGEKKKWLFVLQCSTWLVRFLFVGE